MELTLADTTVTLAAATPATVFDLELAAYERVTVALSNTGANDVTDAEWNTGAGSILANDTVTAAAVLDKLDTGESTVVTLTGDDIPSRLKMVAESTSGTTVAVTVKGELKAADLFPRC